MPWMDVQLFVFKCYFQSIFIYICLKKRICVIRDEYISASFHWLLGSIINLFLLEHSNHIQRFPSESSLQVDSPMRLVRAQQTHPLLGLDGADETTDTGICRISLASRCYEMELGARMGAGVLWGYNIISCQCHFEGVVQCWIDFNYVDGTLQSIPLGVWLHTALTATTNEP